MNLELFNSLWATEEPSQTLSEYQIFLEICEMYFKSHNIKNPVVVELGTYNNSQKKFYEQILGAEHIGIDASIRRSTPDIRGDTHDPKTLDALKKKLNGRPINILFIDASHRYKNIKKDFEMYSPLCKDIIALHDLELRCRDVGRFWEELKEKAFTSRGKYENFLFLSIFKVRSSRRNRRLGIGVIIKQ